MTDSSHHDKHRICIIFRLFLLTMRDVSGISFTENQDKNFFLRKRCRWWHTAAKYGTAGQDTWHKSVPLATEPGISLIILPLTRILQRNLKRTTDTFLFISHTTNVLLFKFCCNIFIGVRIIKEMPGLVASGIPCITILNDFNCLTIYNNLCAIVGQIKDFICLT